MGVCRVLLKCQRGAEEVFGGGSQTHEATFAEVRACRWQHVAHFRARQGKSVPLPVEDVVQELPHFGEEVSLEFITPEQFGVVAIQCRHRR